MSAEPIFEMKLDEIKKNNAIPTDLRLWANTLLYGFILFIIISLYYVATRGTYDLRTANRVTADVGMILIGLSFMLSSICYFWNFADRYIIYRKHLGLVGFGFALLHGVISLFFLSNLFPFPTYYLAEQNIAPFISAVLALVIFSMMALISNRFAVHELGGKRWRQLLRIGYIAYVFSLIHFGLKGYPFWFTWLSGKSQNLFPSFGLLTFLFGVTVILLRLRLWMATHRAIPQPPVPQPPAEPAKQ